jgi:hypothetical protein
VLIHYWPMSNLSDLVGRSHLFGGVNYSFVNDRFNRSKAAIHFNKGYLKAPAGVYFSSDFTITAWIRLNSYQHWSKIIDFGNGPNSDNVMFGFKETKSQLTASLNRGRFSPFLDAPFTSIIKLGIWYHVSYGVQGQLWMIHVNGLLIAKGIYLSPNNVVRAVNYIGKSSYATDSNLDACLDELKIYQGALPSKHIMDEYNKSKLINSSLYF